MTLITNGVLTHRAMAAAELLQAKGVSARVLNMATVRPVDTEAITQAAEETGAIVTCEEHTIFGGLGSAVAETVVQNSPVPMKLLGVPGEFAPTGSANFLLDHYGMSPQGIAENAEALIKQKNP